MKFKLVEIRSKTYRHYSGVVHDLTVEDDHSYNVEKIVVHNSICKTRIQTGVGLPTLYSVSEAYAEKEIIGSNASIIADGGIRYPADLVKSLAAGADAIMCGMILAGTIETPGDKIICSQTGREKKIYAGMASKEVQEKKRGGLKPMTCAEGVITTVFAQGPVRDVIDEFIGGLRSAMTYCNALDISELRKNASFVKISQSSLLESHAFGTKK